MTIEHTFAAGLVLVQAIFLQTGFTADPGDNPQPGQEASAAGWRNVPGMAATVTLDDHGLIEVAGHLGFQFEDQRYCEMDDLFMVGVALFIDGRMVRAPASSMRTENARTGNITRTWRSRGRPRSRPGGTAFRCAPG